MSAQQPLHELKLLELLRFFAERKAIRKSLRKAEFQRGG